MQVTLNKSLLNNLNNKKCDYLFFALLFINKNISIKMVVIIFRTALTPNIDSIKVKGISHND